MSLPKITFTKGSGGLGRVPQGRDYVSGMIFYTDNTPTGFTTESIQRVFSIEDAEALGIVNDFSDETQSTATIEVTVEAAAGDTLPISIDGLSLGTYTSAGSLTVSTEADAIALFINNSTYSHGYTATSDTGVVTITAPLGKGVSLDSGTPLVAVPTGDLEVTLEQFSGGVASEMYQLHYQVAEYFRLNINGELWISVEAVPSGNYFENDELLSLQNAANGDIRQVGLYANAKTTITTSDVGAIQSMVTDVLNEWDIALQVFYSVDLYDLSALGDLPDLSALTANNVSVCISQSLSGDGKFIYDTMEVSAPTLGALLGTVSLSKVSDSIAWVGRYNIALEANECEVVGFQNGANINDVNKGTLEMVNGFRYIFLRKFNGVDGTYWNDSNVSITTTSDYAYIENNRTIDKSIRGVRTVIFPQLNSPLLLNTDGTLTKETIETFTDLSNLVLENMRRNGELSAYSTYINPSQNVLSTSKVEVIIKLLPVGVAREIDITIGFTTSI